MARKRTCYGIGVKFRGERPFLIAIERFKSWTYLWLFFNILNPRRAKISEYYKIVNSAPSSRQTLKIALLDSILNSGCQFSNSTVELPFNFMPWCSGCVIVNPRDQLLWSLRSGLMAPPWMVLGTQWEVKITRYLDYRYRYRSMDI